jgi:hypothetical protein
MIPQINSHLTTTNIYVKKSIIINNIERLNNYKNSIDYNNLNYLVKKEISKIFKKQCLILHSLNLELLQRSQNNIYFPL